MFSRIITHFAPFFGLLQVQAQVHKMPQIPLAWFLAATAGLDTKAGLIPALDALGHLLTDKARRWSVLKTDRIPA